MERGAKSFGHCRQRVTFAIKHNNIINVREVCAAFDPECVYNLKPTAFDGSSLMAIFVIVMAAVDVAQCERSLLVQFLDVSAWANAKCERHPFNAEFNISIPMPYSPCRSVGYGGERISGLGRQLE